MINDIPVANIIRSVRTVGPEEGIGRAAESLRSAGLSELPVVSAGRVVGLVTQEAVLKALIQGDPQEVTSQPVTTIMSSQVVLINRHMSVRQAAEVMADHKLEVVPVIDEYGGYVGVVSAADVTGALCLTIRPPVVAGMATPLGVYLTTGHLRAGAGDLGLFLAGVALMVMNYAAIGIVAGTAWMVQKTTTYPLWAILNSPPVGIPNWMDTVRYIMLGVTMPIFMVLLRVLPLSGYHAAEHQVVHAIEHGEPLKPESVRTMPRVHPRCGTNIAAGVILFLMIQNVVSGDVAVLIAVLILIFAWRVIGGYFQYYVTTKPPNDKQIENGIEAGKALLEKYRMSPAYQVTGWRRIWNTGMPQVMLGVAATVGLVQALNIVPAGLF
jgi:CBS domain-containing protein